MVIKELGVHADAMSALAQKYDLNVPRYTSYPTAPHFSDLVGEADYGSWLESLDPASSLSIYCHVPFCERMCWFCGCHTKVVGRHEPIARYVGDLLADVELVAQSASPGLVIRHLHWGGGSPTMLTADDWQRIMDGISNAFTIDANAEVAVEMDPRTATEPYVAALAAAGVNRASIGVQDFDPRVQAAINRIQPFEVTARVVEWLRAHGIASVNMDLMYGLPHQTTEGVVAMVDQAATLEPDRVALFGYAHVPWMKAHQRLIDEAALPDGPARWSQSQAAHRRLVEHGHVPLGLDHFARPEDDLAKAARAGGLRRNFQGYTTDQADALIGLGTSAIGALPQGYVQNDPALRSYARRVREGRLPVVRGIRLSDEDRLRREVIERLMCNFAVDLEMMAALHGLLAKDLLPDLARIAPLEKDGLAVIDGARIAITEQGRPFVRVAAAAFDTYLRRGENRYSRAV